VVYRYFWCIVVFNRRIAILFVHKSFSRDSSYRFSGQGLSVVEWREQMRLDANRGLISPTLYALLPYPWPLSQLERSRRAHRYTECIGSCALSRANTDILIKIFKNFMKLSRDLDLNATFLHDLQHYDIICFKYPARIFYLFVCNAMACFSKDYLNLLPPWDC